MTDLERRDMFVASAITGLLSNPLTADKRGTNIQWSCVSMASDNPSWVVGVAIKIADEAINQLGNINENRS